MAMKRIGSSGLGYGQTFVIILGFLITSALIFTFGIWVGRDIVERRLAREDRAVRGVVPPPPVVQEDSDAEFFAKLKQKAEDRLRAAPSPDGMSGQGAPAATEISAVEVVPTPTRTLAAAAPILPPTMTPSPLRQPPTAIPTVMRPTPKPTAPRLPTMTRRPADDEWADAGWTVQVNATTNQEEARNLAARLKSRGYEAYVVQAPVRGQTWFRVRVGRLTSRDAAKELEQRLRRAEGIEEAYITPQ